MNDLPVPMSRVERFLAVAAGMEGVTTPEPEGPLEPFLYAIAYNTDPPVAGCLWQEWLALVCGIQPKEPLEVEGAILMGNQMVDVRYLAVAAGMEGVTLPPKPNNRKEEYWARIAEIRPIHGVLKYATGTNITLTDVVSGITSLENVYGDTVQDGTPSPDTPVPVQMVTGKQTVIVSDKENLFDKDTVTNGYRLADWGALYADYAYSTSDFIAVQPSTEYTVTRVEDGTRFMAICQYTSSGVHISRIILPTVATSYTFTTNSACAKIRIADSTYNVSEIFFAQGDGITKNSCLIDLGKNLFDKNNANVINGQIAPDMTLDTSTGKTIWIPIEPNTLYTISKIDSNRARAGTSERLLDGTNTLTYYVAEAVVIPGDRFKTTIRSGENDHYLYFTYSSYTDSGALNSIQIELGAATDFSPYITPIELAKIGTYEDYIYKSGDDWYVHKTIGKYIADGNTSWTKSAYGTNNYSFIPSPSVVPGDNDTFSSIPILKSNAFRGVSYGQRADNIPNCCYGASISPDTCIFIRNNNFDTVQDLTTYCTSNPITFYAILATATDTQITDSTLIAQLEAVASATLPKPVAYITVGSNNPNLPASIKISYYGEEE